MGVTPPLSQKVEGDPASSLQADPEKVCISSRMCTRHTIALEQVGAALYLSSDSGCSIPSLSLSLSLSRKIVVVAALVFQACGGSIDIPFENVVVLITLYSRRCFQISHKLGVTPLLPKKIKENPVSKASADVFSWSTSFSKKHKRTQHTTI